MLSRMRRSRVLSAFMSLIARFMASIFALSSSRMASDKPSIALCLLSMRLKSLLRAVMYSAVYIPAAKRSICPALSAMIIEFMSSNITIVFVFLNISDFPSAPATFSVQRITSFSSCPMGARTPIFAGEALAIDDSASNARIVIILFTLRPPVKFLCLRIIQLHFLHSFDRKINSIAPRDLTFRK